MEILSRAISIPLAAFVLGKRLTRREFATLPETKAVFDAVGTTSESTLRASSLGEGQRPPTAWTILGVILPLALSLVGTTVAPAFEVGSFSRGFLLMIGQRVFALMVAIAMAMITLGIRRGWSACHLGEVMESSLRAAAVIILVTGAGGACGCVLTETGIGGAVADAIAASGIPVLLLRFFIELNMRAAHGAVTLVITTTLGALGSGLTWLR